MKTTITEISLHFEEESPVFGDSTIHVRLEDDGGGYFITIEESSSIVRLDFDAFDKLIEVVNILRNQNEH